VNLVEGSSVEGRDPIEDIKIINSELLRYNADLAKKPQIIAANKMDVMSDEEADAVVAKIKEAFAGEQYPVYAISAVSGKGIRELLFKISETLGGIKNENIVFEQEFFPEEMTPKLSDPYTVEYDAENNEYVVEGPRIERMLGYTNIDTEKGFEFFQNFLKNNGILEELEKLGINEGDTVRMYGLKFDYYK
jgi:GTP-binding protein